MIQLAAADLPVLAPLASAGDSTLFVWVTRDRTIARTQWIMESTPPRVVFLKRSP